MTILGGTDAPRGPSSWRASIGRRVTNAGSGALWLGAIAGILGASADKFQASTAASLGSTAFYSLVGWATGFTYGLLRDRVVPALGGSLLVLGVLLLYPINISWLAAEPWSSRASIVVDCIVLSLTLASVWLLRRWAVLPAPGGPLAATLGLGLFAAVAGFLFVGVETPARDRTGNGPNILLIVLDSVRRDHVNFLGYPRDTSGHLASYLPSARVYENAYATASWTFPSTLDILGASSSQRPDSGFPTRLATLGYATLMLSDNPHLSGPPPGYFGFEEKQRGVADWRYKLSGSIAADVLNRFLGGNDRKLADRLSEWMEGRNGPVYVHAHLMNAHTPFKFPPIDGIRREGRRIEFPVSGQEMSNEERESIIARYDEGVRTAFAAARRMIETMRRNPRPLLVLVTADHGELLGEGGKWFHGTGLEEELLRIPLLAWGTGVLPGRVSRLASNAQLAETILAAATGGVAPRDLRTSDGLDQVEGALPGVAAFRIRGSYKVVVSKEAPITLFSLQERGPAKDVTASKRAMASLMAAGLTLSPALTTQPTPDAATLEVLRSLGYVR